MIKELYNNSYIYKPINSNCEIELYICKTFNSYLREINFNKQQIEINFLLENNYPVTFHNNKLNYINLKYFNIHINLKRKYDITYSQITNLCEDILCQYFLTKDKLKCYYDKRITY